MDGKLFLCEPVLQIGNLTAKNPGQGAFTALVDEIVTLDRAIYVEVVLNVRFRRKLLELGFVEVNKGRGAPNYLFNFEGKLHEYRMEHPADDGGREEGLDAPGEGSL